jgi:hypothetical protein
MKGGEGRGMGEEAGTLKERHKSSSREPGLHPGVPKTLERF